MPSYFERAECHELAGLDARRDETGPARAYFVWLVSLIPIGDNTHVPKGRPGRPPAFDIDRTPLAGRLSFRFAPKLGLAALALFVGVYLILRGGSRSHWR